MKLEIAREYAQLWIEYEMLQLRCDRMHSGNLHYDMVNEMKGVLLSRIRNITETYATVEASRL